MTMDAPVRKNEFSELAVIIPAIKKNVAFPDDLVKRLAGVSLIQRAIDNAGRAFSKKQVYVATDSEEIGLICSRSGVICFYDRNFHLGSRGILDSVLPQIWEKLAAFRDILILSPYVPLISGDDLRTAYAHYRARGAELMVPVGKSSVQLYTPWPRSLDRFFQDRRQQEFANESRAFSIIQRRLLRDGGEVLVEPVGYPLNGRLVEIRNYEDWWLCEKLLNRRRIVFRVIGNKEVGMGHIYRCLALAHGISDHEIRFVCDRESGVAANKLAGYDYWLGVYEPDQIEKAIIELKPDLVVNDILDTSTEYVLRLKTAGIRVVNFEDVGNGASVADLTINDLLEEAQIRGENILWGHRWFFVRDEFLDARPHRFQKKVSRLLITFGGTDPNDFTRKILPFVIPYCANAGIAIDVVSGEGYAHIRELEREIADIKSPEITYAYGTGVISGIMEKTQIAVCSNGRTVYELAHMKIPALVLSHHDRETTHSFSCEENGFVPLGRIDDSSIGKVVVENLQRLVEDVDLRRRLFQRMGKKSFGKNRQKVIDRIMASLDDAEVLP